MSGNPYLIPNYKTMQNDTKTESTCDVTLEQQYLNLYYHLVGTDVSSIQRIIDVANIAHFM